MEQRVVIFLFFAINLAVAGYSFVSDFSGFSKDKSKKDRAAVKSKSFFKGIKYYSLDDFQPQLDLTADELILEDGNSLMTFFSPVGVSYGEEGQEINFSGKMGKYSDAEKVLQLTQGAHLFDQNTNLKCTNATYKVADEVAICEQKVSSKSTSSRTGDKLTVSSDYLKSRLSDQLTTYKGNVKGKVLRKKKYEDPIDFASDVAIVNLVRSQIDLDQNVVLKQMGVTATSRKGEIFLENYNKKLKYFVLSDDVVVKEKVIVQEPEGPREFVRRALSERLEGITSEEVLILTGYPKVYQMDDVIRGNRIILRRDSELVEVEDANSLFYMNEQGKEDKKK